MQKAREQEWNGCLVLRHRVWKNAVYVDLEQGLLEGVQFRSQSFGELPSILEDLKGWEYTLLTDSREIVAEKFKGLKETTQTVSYTTLQYEIEEGKVVASNPEKAGELQGDLDFFLHYGEVLGHLFSEHDFMGFVCREEKSTTVFKFEKALFSGKPLHEKGIVIESNEPLYYGDEVFTGETL